MFGYIKKSKVLKIIDNGIEQLFDKENDIRLNTDILKTEQEKLDYCEAINRLKGGQYFFKCLKRHFG